MHELSIQTFFLAHAAVHAPGLGRMLHEQLILPPNGCIDAVQGTVTGSGPFF